MSCALLLETLSVGLHVMGPLSTSLIIPSQNDFLFGLSVTIKCGCPWGPELALALKLSLD